MSNISCAQCGCEEVTILIDGNCYCPYCECEQALINDGDWKTISQEIHQQCDEACENIDCGEEYSAKDRIIRINELVCMLDGSLEKLDK
jgi:uncharacterized Zn finger protein (UPF0148 family)